MRGERRERGRGVRGRGRERGGGQGHGSDAAPEPKEAACRSRTKACKACKARGQSVPSSVCTAACAAAHHEQVLLLPVLLHRRRQALARVHRPATAAGRGCAGRSCAGRGSSHRVHAPPAAGGVVVVVAAAGEAAAAGGKRGGGGADVGRPAKAPRAAGHHAQAEPRLLGQYGGAVPRHKRRGFTVAKVGDGAAAADAPRGGVVREGRLLGVGMIEEGRDGDDNEGGRMGGWEDARMGVVGLGGWVAE